MEEAKRGRSKGVWHGMGIEIKWLFRFFFSCWDVGCVEDVKADETEREA